MPDPSDREDNLKILHDALAERVTATLIPRLALILKGTTIALAAILAILGWVGYTSLADITRSANRKMTEQADKVERGVAEFLDTTLPKYRAQLARKTAIDRKLPFTGTCRTRPTITQISSVFKEVFEIELARPDQNENILAFVNDANICSTSQIKTILTDPTQRTVEDLYLAVLKRKPDEYGRITWGRRMMIGETYEDVKWALDASTEGNTRRGK